MSTRQSTFVASAAVVILATLAIPASAQHTSVKIPQPQLTLAKATRGTIQGVVLDVHGAPLSGAMVSALGSTVAFALSGRDGRFTLDALPMGAYTVRVHLDGYAPSRRHVVEVRNGLPAMMSVALQSMTVPAPAGSAALLAAGFAPFDAMPTATSANAQPEGGEAVDHDHSDTTWRLRHLKRSVLKTVDGQDMLVGDVEPGGDAEGNRFGRAFESSIRFASSLLSDLPLTGQVNVVTTGSFDGVSGMDTPDAFAAASVAYVALGAPVGGFGQWTVRAAMRQGEVGSWFLTGTFNGRAAGAHRYSGAVAYGTQRLEALNLFGRTAIHSGSRAVGSVSGFDEWTLGKRVSLNYGISYVWQDYLAKDALLSPRVSLTLSPGRYRVRAVVARYATAPGADELLPSTGSDDGSWLPAQRSFSAWSDPIGFRAQTTDHLELAVERVVRDFVLGFRTFYQRTDDQIGTVFAAPTLDRPAASLSHYYVATVGDANAQGWSVSVSRPIVRGLRGAVDYSQTTTKWTGFADALAAPAWFGTTGIDRFHDLTTSLQTDIPQTATRLYVLYRVNTAFARQNQVDDPSGLDSRFDVQLNQGLPFMGFTSADWEVLVAVRNLFRDPMSERSVFDELLVVRPPTRVVGGVRVRF